MRCKNLILWQSRKIFHLSISIFRVPLLNYSQHTFHLWVHEKMRISALSQNSLTQSILIDVSIIPQVEQRRRAQIKGRNTSSISRWHLPVSDNFLLTAILLVKVVTNYCWAEGKCQVHHKSHSKWMPQNARWSIPNVHFFFYIALFWTL